MRAKHAVVVGLGLALVTSCAGSEPEPLEGCPEGTIITGAGCLAVPTRGRPDASVAPDAAGADAGARDAAPPPPDAGAPDAATPDAGPTPIDLSGTWGLVVRTAQVVDTPLSEPETVVIEWRTFVRMAQRELQLEIEGETCAVRAGDFADTTTTYPEVAVRALEERFPIGSLDTAYVGARFGVQEHLRIGGWAPEDAAAEEPLPEGPDDPRVVDGDADGRPGLTLRVTGLVEGRVFVALRDRTSLVGVVVSEDRIEGRTEVERARNNLAATNQLLATEDPTYTPAGDDIEDVFFMQRLDPDLGCAGLAELE